MLLSDRFTGRNGCSVVRIQMSKILFQAPLAAPPLLLPSVFSHQSCEIAALPLRQPCCINYYLLFKHTHHCTPATVHPNGPLTNRGDAPHSSPWPQLFVTASCFSSLRNLRVQSKVKISFKIRKQISHITNSAVLRRVLICTTLHRDKYTKHRAFFHAISCRASSENYYKIYCAEVNV